MITYNEEKQRFTFLLRFPIMNLRHDVKESFPGKKATHDFH